GSELDSSHQEMKTMPALCSLFSKHRGTLGPGAEAARCYNPARMSTLEQLEQMLSKLTKAEKAQLLQWVARDLSDASPGIESTSGVCGGEPCIVRTRIPVWVLEQARRLGATEAML